MLFNPSREEVREFFQTAWGRHRQGLPLEPLQDLAVRWMLEHPEYHPDLEDPEAAHRDYSVESGRTNPFLHLAMHLSLEEQASIDQPPGVRSALDALAHRLGDRHEAMHWAMECLGEMVWTSQRQGTPPDAQAYIDCLQRRT